MIKPTTHCLIIIIAILFLVIVSSAGADCVYGGKSKTSFTRLDSHTIVLNGGYGPKMLIKTFCFIYTSSEVSILKDNFCSYENAVLYVDGEVCDAQSVQTLD
jgi:hypothetical protein